MDRRLPIYFLIDVSESMVGEQIQLVEEGLATIIKELKTDPYALETAHIAIIVFAGQALTLVPLTSLVDFYPPKFPIGGGTSLGIGLGHLMFDMRKNVKKSTLEEKGDWKPIIFLFTDGSPTDDTSFAIEEWKQNWGHKTNLVAISFGDPASIPHLRRLTDHVLLFKNTTPQSYREFFKWVTASIRASSQSVDSNGSGFELSQSQPSDILYSDGDLKGAGPKPDSIDTNFAVFLAKCQNTKQPYLIKYKQTIRVSDLGGGMKFNTKYYRLNGAYPVGSTYFELTGDQQPDQKVSTDELEGFPACPCCGNQWGFSVCACGKLHCVGQEPITVCPWCGNQGQYGFGGGAMNINRTQG